MKYRLMYHLPRSSLLTTASSKTLVAKTPAATELLDLAEKVKHARIDKLKRELESEDRKEALRKENEKRIKQALKRSKERIAEKNEELKEANKKRMQEVQARL